MPTLSDLRGVVRNQTLAESDDVSDANIHLYLNQGLRELSMAFRWPWLEATTTVDVVAATASYALPADYRKLFVVQDTDARRSLTRLTLAQAQNHWGGDVPEGDAADWYYVWDDALYLVPIPGTTATAAYKIYYQKAVTVLAADADTPEFASEFHLILTHYAIARVWEHEEEFEKAKVADDTFRVKVAQMAQYYLKREESDPLIFGGGTRPGLGTVNNLPWLDGV